MQTGPGHVLDFSALPSNFNVIFAQNAQAKSFFPGDVGQRSLSASERGEIRRVVLRTIRADGNVRYPPAYRLCALRPAQRSLAALGTVWIETWLANAGLHMTIPSQGKILRRCAG